jgi:hypothetical protein
MKKTTIYITALLFTCGCISKNDNTPTDAGSLVYMTIETEAASEVKSPYMQTAPTSGNPLNALILATTATDGTYADKNLSGTQIGGEVAEHVTARFQGSSSQLISGVYYNAASKDTINFAALHPQGGWSIADPYRSASFTFNGSQDVMYAPKTRGGYNNSPQPQLEFKHLLTLLKVSFKAESEAVASAWGPIRQMTITSKDGISVDLSRTFDSSCVAYSENGDGKLPFYSTDTDTQFPDTEDYTLPHETMTEAAYVICEPVTALAKDPLEPDDIVRVPEYTVSIVSQHRTISLEIDLMENASKYFVGSTMGYMFRLNLTFQMGNTIAVSASIDDWQTGGIGVGNVTEEQ